LIARWLEVFSPFDGASLEHAKSSAAGALESRSDDDFNVIAKPRQHPQQVVH